MVLTDFQSDFSADKRQTNWRQTNSAGYQRVRYVFVRQEKKEV